jgi:ankyrin repeat protein
VLLASPRVDPNLADVDGDTPLSMAANLGMLRSVKRLLADPRVNVNLVNAAG